MVPERFVGVWLRQSISLDGSPPGEHEQVVWLQTSSTFADLRIPKQDDGSAVEAFSGSTHWDGEMLSWLHELDWHGTFAGNDQGLIDWDDAVMVERGTMAARNEAGDPICIDYVERWAAVPSGEPNVALDGRSSGAIAIHVRMGAWALTQARRGARFGARLERPGAPVVHIGDASLSAASPGHPAWSWTERAGSEDPVEWWSHGRSTLR